VTKLKELYNVDDSMPKKLDVKVGDAMYQSVEFGLVDILLAALYDVRTTDGEPNPESGW
jgi:hypothetical protein